MATYEEVVMLADAIRNAVHNGDLEFVFNPGNGRDVDAVQDGDELVPTYREVDVIGPLSGPSRIRIHLKREV